MHTTPEFGNLLLTRHPLVQHKLSILRDRSTPTKLFKELVEEIAMLMAYEATSDLPLEPVVVETSVLYSILSPRLLLRYVVDPALAARVRALVKAGRTAHPLRYRPDSSPRRLLYVWLAGLNQWRKFRRYYPRVTGTGF